MGRNYTPLPHEYLQEMKLLSDAEFGRLIRALLAYSQTGRMPPLSGKEELFSIRVQMQEDRFQASFDDLSRTRQTAGKRGANARWDKAPSPNSEDGKAISPDGKHGKAILPDSKHGKAILPDGKDGNTEPKPNTKATQKRNPPSEGKEKAPFSPPTVEEVAAYVREKGYHVDPARFVAYYQADDWHYGPQRRPMKSWQRAVINWESRWESDHEQTQLSNPGGDQEALRRKWNLPGVLDL